MSPSENASYYQLSRPVDMHQNLSWPDLQKPLSDHFGGFQFNNFMLKNLSYDFIPQEIILTFLPETHASKYLDSHGCRNKNWEKSKRTKTYVVLLTEIPLVHHHVLPDFGSYQKLLTV
uniref:Ovule protein n=1 Tax=Schistosoma mansoni TaxID=6183 RepID=A0A5K4F7T1_SCHMA